MLSFREGIVLILAFFSQYKLHLDPGPGHLTSGGTTWKKTSPVELRVSFVMPFNSGTRQYKA